MKRSQLGITMIETVGALAVGTLMLVGLSNIIDTSIADLEGHQLGLYQSQIVEAARKYIIQNRATLISSTTSGVQKIELNTLISAQVLPADFPQTNAYGQSACVLVRQVGVGGTPNVKLDALVLTVEGNPIEDLKLAVAASSAGEGGGYVPSFTGGKLVGSSGSFSATDYVLAPCVPTGGHLASLIQFDESATEEFMYRDAVPGNPDLNTMLTPIMMGVGTSAIVSTGSVCDGPAIAVDVNGAAASCVNHGSVASPYWEWSSVNSLWKPSVEKYVFLPTAGAVLGEVRVVRDLGRAFVRTGSGWTALAVDVNGDLNLNKLTVSDGALNVKSATINGDLKTGSMTAGQDISSKNVNVADSLESKNANVNLQAKSKDLEVVMKMSSAFGAVQNTVYAGSLRLVAAPYNVNDICVNNIVIDQYSPDWQRQNRADGTYSFPIAVLSRDSSGLVMCNSNKVVRLPK